jgi:23S rRNA pseudouridine2605 synthase
LSIERLQKILARGGYASRRAAERIIAEGRVRVNGRVVTELGSKADPYKDKVEVNGERVVAEAAVYIVLHKPRGVVTTMSDPEGRPSVAEILAPIGTRVYPVGRLDFATSGVLLATNDGDFAEGMMHPKKAVPKTYVVKVAGAMQPKDLDRWREGIRLEDGVTLPAKLKMLRYEGDKTWFELTIREGRNQQIRRMGEASGFPVMRLARLSFAGITAEGLRPGDWRYLAPDELVDLKKDYGVPKRIVDAEMRPTQRTRTRKAPMKTADAPATRGRASDRGSSSEDSFRSRGQEGNQRGGRPSGPRSRGGEPREAGSRGAAAGGERGRRNQRTSAAGESVGRGWPSERGPGPRESTGRGGSADRGQGPSESAGRGGPSDRRRSRSEPGRGERGAPSAEATGRGRSSGPRSRSEESAPPSRAPHNRGRGRGRSDRSGPDAPASAGQSSTDKPRYGGGAPGRRGYDVGRDWGGGAGRGATGSDRVEPERGGARRGSTSRGGPASDAPRSDVGGRGGQSRTTGSGGGIGAGGGDYRVKGRGGRSR